MYDTNRLHIALIIGSTRPNRFADIPARWIEEGVAERDDIALELLDLRDHRLPFFGEPHPSGDEEISRASVAAWRRAIERADGYIVTAAEYNHAPTGVLKNALDHATSEWHRKPIVFVGYGGVGGARAVEHLRHIAIELQMAPLKAAIHIAGDIFSEIAARRARLDDYPHFGRGRALMLDELVWWARALRVAREETAPLTARR